MVKPLILFHRQCFSATVARSWFESSSLKCALKVCTPQSFGLAPPLRTQELILQVIYIYICCNMQWQTRGAWLQCPQKACSTRWLDSKSKICWPAYTWLSVQWPGHGWQKVQAHWHIALTVPFATVLLSENTNLWVLLQSAENMEPEQIFWRHRCVQLSRSRAMGLASEKHCLCSHQH